MNNLTPRSLFRGLAVTEAITWALLLTGMFLKYVTETTDLGVRIFGMVHGVVFLAYGLVALVTWVNQRWPLGVGLLAVLSALALAALLRGEVGPLLARIAVDALAHQRMGGVEHGFHGGVAVALFAP